jgi:hypothetical protein
MILFLPHEFLSTQANPTVPSDGGFRVLSSIHSLTCIFGVFLSCFYTDIFLQFEQDR